MIAFSGEIVLAIEAWDGNLQVNGFLRNDSAWRLEDGAYNLHGPTDWNDAEGLEKGDWVMNRTTLQLEGRWKISDNLSVTGLYRGAYEASLYVDGDLEQHFLDSNVNAPRDRQDEYTYHNDIREFYADLSWGDWAMRIGKQQIVWGEALGFRMSDIINPLDYSWNYFYPSWEDIRIPLWGVDVTRRLGDKAALELVYLPGTFDNGFESTGYGIAGTHWAPGTYQPGFLDNIKTSEPENDISNGEFGARLKLLLGAWDTSLFYFYSRHDNPILDPDWLNRLTVGRSDIYNFPFNSKFGGTFNIYSSFLDAVIRGECVYTFDEPYHSNKPDIYLQPMPTFESDTFAYMLAIDKLVKIPFLNERNNFFFSSQFAQKFISDHDVRMDTPDTDDESSHTIATIYIDTKYMYEKLTPSIFFMYNFSGEYIVNPQVTYDINDYWSIGLGAQIIEADSLADPFFGLHEDNDQVYTFVKFGF